jgi:hypothetical protein
MATEKKSSSPGFLRRSCSAIGSGIWFIVTAPFRLIRATGRGIKKTWNYLFSKKTSGLRNPEPSKNLTSQAVSTLGPNPNSAHSLPQVTFTPVKKGKNLSRAEKRVRIETIKKMTTPRCENVVEDEIVELTSRIKDIAGQVERLKAVINKDSNHSIHHAKNDDVEVTDGFSDKNSIQEANAELEKCNEILDELNAKKDTLLKEKKISLLTKLQALPADCTEGVRDELEEITTQLQADNNIYYTGKCAEELDGLRKTAQAQGNNKLAKKLDVMLDSIALVIEYDAKRDNVRKQVIEVVGMGDSDSKNFETKLTTSPGNTTDLLYRALRSPRKSKPFTRAVEQREQALVKLKSAVERKQTFGALTERINLYLSIEGIAPNKEKELHQLCKAIASNYARIREEREQTIFPEEEKIIKALEHINVAATQKAIALAIKNAMIDNGNDSILKILEQIVNSNQEELLKIGLRNHIETLEESALKTALCQIKDENPKEKEVLDVINKIKNAPENQKIIILEQIITETAKQEPERFITLRSKVEDYNNANPTLTPRTPRSGKASGNTTLSGSAPRKLSSNPRPGTPPIIRKQVISNKVLNFGKKQNGDKKHVAAPNLNYTNQAAKLANQSAALNLTKTHSYQNTM